MPPLHLKLALHAAKRALMVLTWTPVMGSVKWRLLRTVSCKKPKLWRPLNAGHSSLQILVPGAMFRCITGIRVAALHAGTISRKKSRDIKSTPPNNHCCETGSPWAFPGLPRATTLLSIATVCPYPPRCSWFSAKLTQQSSRRNLHQFVTVFASIFSYDKHT